MTRCQQPALTIFALGAIGLGVLALIYGDFALVWQPVALWVPGRTGLTYFSGFLMLSSGVGLLFGGTAAWSVRILFPYLIVWASAGLAIRVHSEFVYTAQSDSRKMRSRATQSSPFGLTDRTVRFLVAAVF